MGHIGLMGPIGRGTGTNIVDGSNWEDWGGADDMNRTNRTNGTNMG